MVESTVALGGLLRCCLKSLDDYLQTIEELPQEGSIHTCEYCDGEIIFKEGIWRWNQKNQAL